MARFIQTKDLTGFDTEASMIADGVYACHKLAKRIGDMYNQPTAIDFEAWNHAPGESISYRFFSSSNKVEDVASYSTEDFSAFCALLSWLLKGDPNVTPSS